MEIGNLPEALKTIMAQRGWSQMELGRQLGMSQVWVSQVTRGERDTGIANAITRLARVGWEVVIRPKREDPVKRRQFIAAATSVTFIPGSQTTPYQDAEYVRTLATRLSTGLYDHGGIPILPSALRHAQRLQSAINSTDRALQAAASDLITWAAWIAGDVRRFDMAEQLGRFALNLAERADDQEARATALSALAQINMDRRQLDHAVMYAKRGVALPGTEPIVSSGTIGATA